MSVATFLVAHFYCTLTLRGARADGALPTPGLRSGGCSTVTVLGLAAAQAPTRGLQRTPGHGTCHASMPPDLGGITQARHRYRLSFKKILF